MKHSNKRIIFGSILNCPCSRSELADKLNLSRAAITTLIDEMINEGLIYEAAVHSGGVGRRPIMLDVQREKIFIGGLMIHRRTLEMGFINLAGQTLCQTTVPNGKNPWKILSESAETLLDFSRTHGLDENHILGMGISAPGPLDTIRGILLNPPNFDAWHNVPVIEILSKKLPWTMQLHNLTDSLVLEEKYYGMGQNCENLMVLQIDEEGVGSGIIVHNQLFRDLCEIGGMIGHMSICYNGKHCSCGNQGCLEAYASIGAILECTPFASWRETMDAVSSNLEAKRLVEKEAVYIATAIINSIHFINPDKIIITGDLNYKHAYLEARINEIVKKRMIFRDYGSKNRVVFSDTCSSVRTGAISFLNAYLHEFNDFTY